MDFAVTFGTQRRSAFGPVGVLLCVLLVPATGCISHQKIRESEGHRTLSIANLNDGDTAGAITRAKQAVKANRWDANAWQALGLAYFAADITDEAEKALLKSLKLQPEFSQAQLNLGSLYLAAERWDDAILWLERAAKNPEYRQPDRAMHNLGWAWFNKGEYSKARKYYQRVLREFDRFCPALLNLGLVDEAEGKIEDALKRYQQAAECDPSDLNAKLNLGIVEGRLDMLSDACKHLSVVEKADPYGELHDRARDYLKRLECEQFSKM